MTSLAEQLSLNGLELNPLATGTYGLEELDLTPPKKRLEWLQSADSDGAILNREPLYENRTIAAKVRIDQQGTMDEAIAKIAAIVDRLQEAQKNPGGVPVIWTPAQGSKSVTFYCLAGEITNMPITVDGELAGWFVKAPVLNVQLTCRPFGYLPEEEVQAAVANTAGLSIVTFTLAGIKGDVPAEGRLVVKDTAGKGRRYVEWGLEQRYYNAATALVIDNESLTPVGGAQSETLNANAYKPGPGTKGTLATTLLAEPTICCNTGVLKHVGTFHVKARAQVVLGTGSLPENVYARLSFQDGEGPLRGNEWDQPVLGGSFVELDLGTITVTPAKAGTQKWLGQIEAYSTNTAAADVLHIDYLVLIPVLEGYGQARGPNSSSAGTIAAFDNFTSGTLSGSLNTRTPAAGAAWATSGAATDWTVAAGEVTRASTGDAEPRFGVLGSTLENSRVVVQAQLDQFAVTGTVTLTAIVRWTNASNYAFVNVIRKYPKQNYPVIQIGVVVAGVTTILAEKKTYATNTINLEVSLTATVDGTLTAQVSGTAPAVTLSGTHSSLATAGTLVTGKAGVADKSTVGSAVTRHISSVAVAQLPAIPYCIQPNRTIEFRSDSTLTADGTGTYYGQSPLARGQRFYVPPAGQEGRTSRVIVKADRNDLEAADQQTIADACTAQCFVTPRIVAVPR